MADSTGAAKETMGFMMDGFPALSNNVKTFIRDHPQEAWRAVIVALEVIAAQWETKDADMPEGQRPLLDRPWAATDDAEVPERLRPFLVRRSGDDFLGVSEAAKRLEVSRTTVYDWVDRKTLIAWRSTKRGLRIPAAQILGAGKVVARLGEVVETIGDPELAWTFLSQEWPFDDMATAPLALLKAGRVEDVLDAAAGFGATFT